MGKAIEINTEKEMAAAIIMKAAMLGNIFEALRLWKEAREQFLGLAGKNARAVRA